MAENRHAFLSHPVSLNVHTTICVGEIPILSLGTVFPDVSGIITADLPAVFVGDIPVLISVIDVILFPVLSGTRNGAIDEGGNGEANPLPDGEIADPEIIVENPHEDDPEDPQEEDGDINPKVFDVAADLGLILPPGSVWCIECMGEGKGYHPCNFNIMVKHYKSSHKTVPCKWRCASCGNQFWREQFKKLHTCRPPRNYKV